MSVTHAFLCFLLSGNVIFARQSSELRQAFLDLSNDAVVMNISAHPDDEDGSTLAYYRMKYGVKTYSVLFTRGEGGQNETGPELYEELGVLRTDETHEAGTILGAEVHFLNLSDFGYSKTASETFQKWGGAKEVLRRLVYVIRKYKPDVLFTNHNTIGGHGHHQAVAITAIAAFDAAADSTMFPEQLQLPGMACWQPKKLFFRNFGAADQTADVVNQIGETDPASGLSYLDIASEALTRHKTQGMDRADLRRFTRGLSLYRLIRANSMYVRDTTTFLGGVDVWRDPGLTPLQNSRAVLSRLHHGMSRDSVLEIASQIMRFSTRKMQLSPLAHRVLSRWQEGLEALVIQLCAIQATWEFADQVVVPTQKVKSTLTLSASECVLSEFRYSVTVPQGWAVNESAEVVPVPHKGVLTRGYDVFVGDNATLTLPKTVAQYNSLESEQTVALHAHVLANGKPLTLTVRPRFDVAPFQVMNVTPNVARFSPDDAQGGKGSRFH
ncbi:MAG: PIG-L family deacetylase [Bacteroidetes bacterium]|nr:PIG-L family deacetylase [Bacteroidota bacterium]